MIGSSTTLSPQRAQAFSPLSQSLLHPSSRPTGGEYPRAPNAPAAPTGLPGPKTGGAKPAYTGQSTIRPPQYIDINTTEDAVNNVIAKGYQEGNTRYQLKQTDRAGLSRGKANQFMAEQGGVQAMTKAAAEAAGVRAEDDKNNAKMRSDYEKMRELEALNYAMAQHSMSQTNWAQEYAQQKNAIDLMNALMR